MAIKDIIEKIKNDALNQADQLKQKNDKEIALINAESKEKINAIQNETAQSSKKRYDEEKRLKVSLATLELKNKLLSTKQSLIDSAFEKALADIKKLPTAEYKNLLINAVSKVNAIGNEEIILGSDDFSKFGAALVDEINAAVTINGKKANFKKTNEQRQNITGCILRDGRKETICTFEAMIADKRKELEKEVAKILLKG